MTDTPMTPAREQELRYWHKELAGITEPTQAALRAALGDLLAEVDRLRARVAELEGAPVDEAAELSEGQAQLEAMRADHPAPCRVPDSPDCTCPLTEEQARRVERDRQETNITHDCGIPLTRRLDCGHCPHEVCQDCDRCPHSCRCAQAAG